LQELINQGEGCFVEFKKQVEKGLDRKMVWLRPMMAVLK